MAWGKRKQDDDKLVAASPTARHSAALAAKVTLLGPTLVVTGELVIDEEMLVLGKVVGKVISKTTVHVGPEGTIEGDVVCDSLLVEGCLRGNVEARRSITIEPSGKLIGDIVTKEFINRPGGFFEGFSRMMHGGQPKAEGADSKAKAKQEN